MPHTPMAGTAGTVGEACRVDKTAGRTEMSDEDNLNQGR